MTSLLRRVGAVKKIVLAYEDSLPSSWLEGLVKLRGKLERAGIEVGGSMLLIRSRRRQSAGRGAEARLGVDILVAPLHHLPGNADVVLTHKDLADKARQGAPGAWVVPIARFAAGTAYDEIVAWLLAGPD